MKKLIQFCTIGKFISLSKVYNQNGSITEKRNEENFDSHGIVYIESFYGYSDKDIKEKIFNHFKQSKYYKSLKEPEIKEIYYEVVPII